MKNFIKITVALLLITVLAVTFIGCGKRQEVIKNNFGETYYTNIDTILTYKLDGQNVNKAIEEKKSLAVQGCLNGLTQLKETPKCEFSRDFMVTFKEKEYLLAHDGCNIVKYEGNYYEMTVSDRKILDSIFRNYGAKIEDVKVEENH